MKGRGHHGTGKENTKKKARLTTSVNIQVQPLGRRGRSYCDKSQQATCCIARGTILCNGQVL